MPLSIPAPRTEERVIAGVCAGIARALAVDVTLVRLVFTLLALAGGAGILLYLALWAYSARDRPWWAAVLVLVAGSALLHSVGLSDRSVAGIALVAAGLAIVWWRGAGFRADAPVSYFGVAVAAIGVVVLLQGGDPSAPLLAPGAIAGALLLIAGPWLWRLAVERDAERAARIRSEERADVAARVHDSVLQTLALIQRHVDDPRRVAAIARRQERELRGWLYGEQPLGDDEASLVGALSTAAADVEELYGVRVELASAGDCPVDDEQTGALVLAAREAMTNAAKFAGVEEIDVYLEATGDEVSVFVRDRGSGFDRAEVPEDRRGLAESIEGRLERAGGSATITSVPGEGTEVELRVPRSAP
jgi:signal transduction histidine kinase